MLALACSACGDGGEGGPGGTGGNRTEPELRFAHLAPEVPSAADTAVDLLVDGETMVEELRFGWAADFVTLPAGEHELGIAIAGESEPIFTAPVELENGDVLTVVAYRVSAADPPLDVFMLDGRLDELQPGHGRVVLAHGADAAVLSVVDVIIAADGACPPALVSGFEFGEQWTLAPDPQAMSFPLALSAPDGDCIPALPPLSATVAADVATLWIAVDRDTGPNLRPAMYVLVGDASGAIPDLNPVSP